MQLVIDKIALSELNKMSERTSIRFVKAVVDIDQQIMAVDAPLHADEEFILIENGSKHEHLWGINIFPEQFGFASFLVFEALINFKPDCGNRSRIVENIEIQETIKKIVTKLVAS